MPKGTLIYHYRSVHMNYKQFCCTLCGKKFPTSCNVKYHILRVHDKMGNMDGKLKTVIESDYFEGRNAFQDMKVTDPESWPDKNAVLAAIQRARQTKIEVELN